ncbi:MAG: PASTA domain-containing protein [Ruminococcaceae bacterium]|nr:PASTA domain-containing protein [Oscillospiraceae bacterium]
MKLRITKKRTGVPSRRQAYRLLGKGTVSRDHREDKETISLFALFEMAALNPPAGAKRKKRKRRPLLRPLLARLRHILGLPFSALVKRIKGKKRPRHTKKWLGALCASLLVSALCATVLLVHWFVPNPFTPEQRVSIPRFVGESYREGDMEHEGEYYVFDVSYVYDEAEAGTVLSQTPRAGLHRLIRRGDPLHVSLVVSRGRRTVALPELSLYAERDARLLLKNQSVRFAVAYTHSDTVPKGHVVSTQPKSGTLLTDTDTVTLTVSLGTLTHYTSVPPLWGLTEAEAAYALQAAQLSMGEVLYRTSDRPAGTVIAQSAKAGESLEVGSTVTVTVSAGQAFEERTVPDLFGLTLPQAEAALAACGLVIGQTFSVQSGIPTGTVIAQSIPPHTVITSAVTAVDLYISA